MVLFVLRVIGNHRQSTKTRTPATTTAEGRCHLIPQWIIYDERLHYSFVSFFPFWSGLQGPNAYSLWYGVVPKPSIGEGYL